MKNFLTSLNGWQRIYAVLFVFLYFPLLITFAVSVYVDPTKSIVIEENLKIELAKRKINIEIKVLKDADYSNTTAKLPTVQELEKNEVIEIQGSNFYWKYYLQINKEVEEKIQQEISSILYNEIENEFRKKYINETIKIVGFGMVIAFFIYVFGYAIGWVIKGFKQSKES